MRIYLNRYREPETYKRSGHYCYYDKISKQLRPKTPEEKVRLKFVEYLHRKMLVPYNVIEIEVPIVGCKDRLNKRYHGRMDIIIQSPSEDQDGQARIVLVVECKSESVNLTDDVLDQVCDYADIVDAPFVCMTNGIEVAFYFYNKETKAYNVVSSIPTYEQMCHRNKIKILSEKPFSYKRLSETFSKKLIANAIRQMNLVGKDTGEEYYPLVIHLQDCLWDDNKLMRKFTFNGYTIVDKGLRYTSFGNASGGNFPGMYRCFLVTNMCGNSQIVSFVLTGYLGSGKHSKNTTCLNVAVDDFEKHHNSLQMVLEKYVVLKANRAYFYHDGKMANGQIGSVKNNTVMSYVQEECPYLIDENKKEVFLGSISIDMELYVDDPDVKKLLGNSIVYALLRDEIRKVETKKRK